MNYYKSTNNEVFAYDDEQVKQGYGKDLEEITEPLFNGKILKGHKAITRDEGGNISNAELLPIIEAETLKQQSIELKQYILKAVSTMAVGEDINGIYVLFDGKDEATDNIQKAITSLVADETTMWRVYDNTTVIVNQTILGKVLRKAGIVKTKLWFCKTKEEVDEIVSYHQEWLDKFTKTDNGRWH